MRGCHGARREQGEEKGGWQGWEGAEPLGVGRYSWDREASRVDPKPHHVEGEEEGREASGVEENPGEGRQGVGGGVESSPDDSTRHGEVGGVQSSQDNSTPNGRGGGVESWQDDFTQNENEG